MAQPEIRLERAGEERGWASEHGEIPRNSEQQYNVDTCHTDVSKTVTPANYLIPVCQPMLSITMNMVEDLGSRPAGQGRKGALSPAIPHTWLTLQSLMYQRQTSPAHSNNIQFPEKPGLSGHEKLCTSAVDLYGMDPVSVTVISHHDDFTSLTDGKFQNALSVHEVTQVEHVPFS